MCAHLQSTYRPMLYNEFEEASLNKQYLIKEGPLPIT